MTRDTLGFAILGVQRGVVLQRRVEPVFQQVKQALDDDTLGKLTLGAVTIPYLRSQSYRIRRRGAAHGRSMAAAC